MPRQPLVVRPVSLDLAFNDVEKNLDMVEAAVKFQLQKSGAAPEAQLFVFPELTLTGFVTEDPPGFSLDAPDSPVRRLRELAKTYKTAIAAGFPEKNPAAPKKPFNNLSIFGPDGGVIASYHKLHLFTVGACPETGTYSPGIAGVLAGYRGWKIGLSLCFDLRFPNLYQGYAAAGADLILAPSCWIGGPHKAYQFKTLGSAHAVLTQSYLVLVNRSGKDPNFEYEGGEHVFSPFGEDVFKGGGTRLDEVELQKARKLSVRSADRPEIPLRSILPSEEQ